MSTIKDKAEQLLAARLDVVARLEEANTALTQARQRNHEAESSTAAAWNAATAAGWTPAELRKLGFTAPPTRRGGRPKGTRHVPPGSEAS